MKLRSGIVSSKVINSILGHWNKLIHLWKLSNFKSFGISPGVERGVVVSHSSCGTMTANCECWFLIGQRRVNFIWLINNRATCSRSAEQLRESVFATGEVLRYYRGRERKLGFELCAGLGYPHSVNADPLTNPARTKLTRGDLYSVWVVDNTMHLSRWNEKHCPDTPFSGVDSPARQFERLYIAACGTIPFEFFADARNTVLASVELYGSIAPLTDWADG